LEEKYLYTLFHSSFKLSIKFLESRLVSNIPHDAFEFSEYAPSLLKTEYSKWELDKFREHNRGTYYKRGYNCGAKVEVKSLNGVIKTLIISNFVN
jgi:hypothetical protein